MGEVTTCCLVSGEIAFMVSVDHQTNQKGRKPMAQKPPNTYEVVLNAINSEPSREWTAQSVIDATGLSVIDVMVALPHLTYRRDIRRTTVGRYRSNLATTLHKAG